MSNSSTTKPKKKAHNASTTSIFIDKAIAKHGTRYGYSNVVYINAITKVNITCSKHGDFLQTPNTHLRGRGCPVCSGKKKTTEIIVRELINARGDRYDYSLVEYKKGEKLSIICKKHGLFKQGYWYHLRGQNCPKCCDEIRNNNARLNFSELLQDFNKTHNNKYDYSDSVYISVDTPILIKCPIHGSFKQTPYHHRKQKSGCPKCTKASPYSRSRYVKACEKYNGISSLYLIKMTNNSECFYKIGITATDIKSRFQQNPYNIEVLYMVAGDAGFVFDLETQLHRLLRDWHYKPNIKFGGCATECFSFIPKGVIKLLDRIKSDVQLQLIA